MPTTSTDGNIEMAGKVVVSAWEIGGPAVADMIPADQKWR